MKQTKNRNASITAWSKISHGEKGLNGGRQGRHFLTNDAIGGVSGVRPQNNVRDFGPVGRERPSMGGGVRHNLLHIKQSLFYCGT